MRRGFVQQPQTPLFLLTVATIRTMSAGDNDILIGRFGLTEAFDAELMIERSGHLSITRIEDFRSKGTHQLIKRDMNHLT